MYFIWVSPQRVYIPRLGLSALLLFRTARMSGHLVETGQFQMYALMQMAVSFSYVISDDAGDGMTIEMNKYEPEVTRDYFVATGQLIRFSAAKVLRVM